ncbi:dihydropteroate synthase, partial [Staphylococcus aureus]|uniref:dihydropteroate synthase n=1 Tax=Staphylococcus aureus TaxID=1280 RepID=UPI0037DA6E87
MDLGRVSTRPRHEMLSLQQHINTLLPLLQAILPFHLKISLHTFPTHLPQPSLKLPLHIINHQSPPLYHHHIFQILPKYH